MLSFLVFKSRVYLSASCPFARTCVCLLVFGNTVVCVSITIKCIGHIHQVCPIEGVVSVLRREGHQLLRERAAMTLHQIHQRCVGCRKVTWKQKVVERTECKIAIFSFVAIVWFKSKEGSSDTSRAKPDEADTDMCCCFNDKQTTWLCGDVLSSFSCTAFPPCTKWPHNTKRYCYKI